MIGLDTNVLVRYLVGDDVAQSKSAIRVIEGAASKNESCFLSLIVLCETVWVLESAYDENKEKIVEVMNKILATRQFEIENRDAIRKALEDFSGGKGDFSDYLIGTIHTEQGCRVTYTFDKSLKNARGFSSL